MFFSLSFCRKTLFFNKKEWLIFHVDVFFILDKFKKYEVKGGNNALNVTPINFFIKKEKEKLKI